MKSTRVPDASVIDAPTSAPPIVNISRNMPILTFVMWSRTYADAAPLEVAITETALIAIARLMLRPQSVRTGMRTTPPPMPLIAPTKPAAVDNASTYSIGMTAATASMSRPIPGAPRTRDQGRSTMPGAASSGSGELVGPPDRPRQLGRSETVRADEGVGDDRRPGSGLDREANGLAVPDRLEAADDRGVGRLRHAYHRPSRPVEPDAFTAGSRSSVTRRSPGRRSPCSGCTIS